MYPVAPFATPLAHDVKINNSLTGGFLKREREKRERRRNRLCLINLTIAYTIAPYTARSSKMQTKLCDTQKGFNSKVDNTSLLEQPTRHTISRKTSSKTYISMK